MTEVIQNKKILKVYPSFILGICQCGCGQDMDIRTTDGLIRKYINHHNVGKGEKNPNWQGGIIPDKDGYLLEYVSDYSFKCKGNKVRQHRLVYERYYNCILLPCTEIDHINGIKDDNRIENLRPIYKIPHVKRHHPFQDFSGRKCKNPYCKYENTYQRQWFGDKVNGYLCRGCYRTTDEYREYNKLNMRKQRARKKGLVV